MRHCMRHSILALALAVVVVATARGQAPPAPSPHTAPAILTVEQAADVHLVSDVQFSPDGKRLAFSVALPPKGTTRKSEIWVMQVADRELRRFAASAKTDRMPRWSGPVCPTWPASS